MAESDSKQYEIAIVGAGMVGLSLACALADKGIEIAILDRSMPPSKASWQGFDPRVSAIVKSSEHFFKNIGVWSFIENERHCAYQGMEVWEQDGTARIEFDAMELGYTELGYIIENRIMQWAMMEKLKQYNSVHWLCPENISQITKEKVWEIEFESGLKLTAELLVGADGAFSYVRDFLGIEIKETNLEHKALVCNVVCEKEHNNIARQIFLKSGPLAFLPLAENPRSCSIVWSSDYHTSENLMAMDEAAFNDFLGKKFENTLGKIQSSDKRFSFPLFQRHAETYISEQAALIGDAAHTIHPLAGQGVNLGYMDAAVLAEEIIRAKKRGIAISGKEVLRRYERRRRGQVTLMMTTMRGFQQTFSIRNADFIGLRNLGVRLTNRIAPVKHHILSRAMGIDGDVPDIAREPLNS